MHSWIWLAFDALLATGFSLVVLTKRRGPAITLAWILGFFLLPYLGILFYLFFGYRRFRRKRRPKPTPSARAAENAADQGTFPSAASLRSELAPVAELAARLTGFGVATGNRVRIFQDSNTSYSALAHAIQNARHHIHLEYFVFKPDQTGRFFRDLLIQQARRGIECRLLVDAVGSWQLNKKFLSPLADAGVRTAFFWPVKLFRRPWGFHLRNHRKIAVIDGETGFIGSQNIGNEYLFWQERKMSWQDVSMLANGPVVAQMQAIFSEDWSFTTGENLQGKAFFPDLPVLGTCRAQTLPTGPDENERALQLIFLSMVQAARQRVCIMSPYFVPTEAMALALESAARRGVRVTLLLPHWSDHPLTRYAGRSWYPYFLEAGVEIYEQPDRFIHAKVALVDEDVTLLGSANMDVRSFLINFEASVLVYDAGVNAQLREAMDAMIAQSRPVRRSDLLRLPFYRQVAEGFCRLLSPLL